MEGKLDQLITLVTNLNAKFDVLDSKVENLSKRLVCLEEKVKDKFAEVDNELKLKTSSAHTDELQGKVSSLEDQLEVLYSDLKKGCFNEGKL